MSVENSSTSESLNKRYSNAYKVARGIIAYGRLVKGIGIFLGVVIVILGIAAASSTDVAVSGIAICLFGVCVAVTGYFAGIVLAAGGQMMFAAIDTAVNTSTLIPNDEKASIIGLSYT